LTTALVTAGVMTFAQNQKSVMGSSVVEWKSVEAKPTIHSVINKCAY